MMLSWSRCLTIILTLMALTACPVAIAQNKDYWDHMSPVTPRLTEFQRVWWSMVETRTGGDPARMASMLASNKPAFFTPSCSQPLIAGDSERLQQAFATVLLSGVPGQPGSATGSGERGRFLACLGNSGASALKARIEVLMLNAITSNTASYTPIMCKWTLNATTMATAFLNRPQIGWYASSDTLRNLAVYSPDQAGSRSYATFPNILMHELIHAGGHAGEDLPYTATACCGDEVHDRAAACKSLDAMIARDRAAYALATAMRRGEHFATLTPTFPSDDALALAHRFFLSLAAAMPGMTEASERATCISRSGRETCKARAGAIVAATLSRLFPGECTDAVSGGSADLCAAVSKTTKNELARAMTDQLFPEK